MLHYRIENEKNVTVRVDLDLIYASEKEKLLTQRYTHIVIKINIPSIYTGQGGKL